MAISTGAAADLTNLFEAIANAFRVTLGDDLIALYAYGSGADGTYIPGFSDLDLAAFCDGTPTRGALLRLGGCWNEIEISPFSYLQVRYIDVSEIPCPTLVAGSLRPLTQPIADIGPYLYENDELSSYAGRWLAGLAPLLDDDLATWSVCAGRLRRLRHLRLVMTRVKPTVRSLIARSGVSATRAFSTSWVRGDHAGECL